MNECLTKSVKMKLCRSFVSIVFGKNIYTIRLLFHFFNSAYYLVHLSSAEDFEPVNRYFTAKNPEPQPDLECLVGIHSAAASEMYRVKCTDAWNISVKYDRKKANSLAADRHISEHDRRLRIIKYVV